MLVVAINTDLNTESTLKGRDKLQVRSLCVYLMFVRTIFRLISTK